jgi:hypothetical protein
MSTIQERITLKKLTREDVSYMSKLTTKQLSDLIGYPEYIYMLTFTIDPKRHKNPDLKEIEEYIIKQLKRKPLQITKAYLVKEGNGKDVHHHWHAAISTKKYLKADRFAYYQKLYGRYQINRSKTDDINETLIYISKENKPNEIKTLSHSAQK